jgi:hypothetical protein
MLPSVTTLTAAPRLFVAALAITAAVAAPVEARDRTVTQDDLLKGVVASVLIGTVVNGMMQPQVRQPQPLPVRPAPVYQPAPVYHPAPVYQPAPVYVPQPVYAPAPVSIYRTPAGRAFNSYSRHERQAIQRRLAIEGYYYGGIDGSFGPGTYNAVAAYASDARLTRELGSTSGAFGVYDSLLY